MAVVAKWVSLEVTKETAPGTEYYLPHKCNQGKQKECCCYPHDLLMWLSGSFLDLKSRNTIV